MRRTRSSPSLDAPVELVRAEVYNVGDTNENYRKLDLVELLQKRVPEADVSFVHRDEDPRDYRVNFDKIAERARLRGRAARRPTASTRC